jgi:hypothetical protein
VGAVVEVGVAGSADGGVTFTVQPESAETSAAEIRKVVMEVALTRFICVSLALSSAAILV